MTQEITWFPISKIPNEDSRLLLAISDPIHGEFVIEGGLDDMALNKKITHWALMPAYPTPCT